MTANLIDGVLMGSGGLSGAVMSGLAAADGRSLQPGPTPADSTATSSQMQCNRTRILEKLAGPRGLSRNPPLECCGTTARRTRSSERGEQEQRDDPRRPGLFVLWP